MNTSCVRLVALTGVMLTPLVTVPAGAAGTATGSLTVKASVQAACYVNTDNSGVTSNGVINFGMLSSLSSNQDASTSTSGGAQVGVLCSRTTGWSLAANGGQHAISAQRYMIGGSGADTLKYDLYSDSSRATAIAINGIVATGTGTGSRQAFDIYGRIPSGTALPPAGDYLDTVQLTVTF